MEQIDWHKPGLIPELLYFQNGNEYTGSARTGGGKEFRYKMGPADDNIKAEVWFGPFCYEKSEVFAQADFPLSEEGRSGMLDWLGEQYNKG